MRCEKAQYHVATEGELIKASMYCKTLCAVLRV